jgi:hypothetical protein
MGANELRLNNLIQDTNTNILIVNGLHENKIYSIYPFGVDAKFEQTTDANKIEPIPLTEESIIKLGFKYYADAQYILEINDIEFNWDKETGIYIFNGDSEFCFELEHIEYVHQLQNLFFALTNTELVWIK